MRTCDLNIAGEIWEYTPERHKTQNHGKARTIYIGRRAQEDLRPWLRTELERHLFSLAEAEAERRESQRQSRKPKVQPSQAKRKIRHPKLQPGDRYTAATYFQAVGYAIKRANRERKERGEPEIPAWHPHQLRHNFATEIRRQHGLEVARVLLGHSSPVVTEVRALERFAHRRR